MVDSLFHPISPPTSPGMSDSEWHSQDLKTIDPALSSSDGGMAVLHGEVSGHSMNLEKRPMLRTHKTFPYVLQMPSSHPTPLDSANSSPVPQPGRITISGLDELQNTEPLRTFSGGSAPPSPVSRLTPPSPSIKKDDENQELALEDACGEDDMLEEEEDDQPKQPMTAQELRAQKRKMKRFRLTHNQTRFLMSEFARQAHPDAAHRERLAREIPGLSPRQVQVWFQNRRAKLKRLTSDDRERMMRSRALPEDFDMTQALHSPFPGTHSVGTPLASPASYSPAFADNGMMRSLSIDTLRRMPEATHMSPTGISPAFGNFNFTPPQSATDSLSPISAPGDGPFGFSSASLDSPRRPNPFVGSVTSGSGYTSHPQIPRLHNMHDRIQRSRAESLTSPLRTSMSYGESLNASHDSSPQYAHDGPRALSNPILPYGLGYSYNQIPGFQASASTRMRSFSGTVPRRIELSTHYTHSRSSTTPQTASFPTYQSASLSTPHSYEMAHLSAPHHITSFQNNFLRHDGSDQYSPVGAVLGEVVDSHSHDGDHESHDGSVLSQHY